MESKNKVALGLMGGMLMGAVAGLVVAPKTGQDMRTEIRDVLSAKADQFRNRVKGSNDGVDDSVGDSSVGDSKEDSIGDYAEILG